MLDERSLELGKSIVINAIKLAMWAIGIDECWEHPMEIVVELLFSNAIVAVRENDAGNSTNTQQPTMGSRSS